MNFVETNSIICRTFTFFFKSSLKAVFLCVKNGRLLHRIYYVNKMILFNSIPVFFGRPLNQYSSVVLKKTPAYALHYFCKLLSFSCRLNFSTNFRPFFDQIRQNFDKSQFDELSFDVISTKCRIRPSVTFYQLSIR